MSVQSIDERYRTAASLIADEVQALHESDLAGTSADHWVEYFMRKYGLQAIRLLPNSPTLEQRVDRVEKRTLMDRPYWAEQEVAVIGLPVDDNRNLSELLGLRATQWYLDSPHWVYRDGSIFVEVSAPDPEAVKREIEQVRQCIAWLNKDIEVGNEHLPRQIRQLVERRMEVVNARAQTFQTLAEAIGAELRLTSGAERQLSSAPRVRDSIRELRRPQPSRKTIPRLKPQEFQTILDVIDAQCVSFERTPATIAKLNEDDIRNLILASLNGAFNLGAVGEVFSKTGKTDIYLAVPDGGIFIAECKIWRGAQTLHEAVGQILGYLTWRDAYGVVLIFCRNKGFSSVLKAIPETVGDISSLRGEIHAVDQRHWSARNCLPGDDYQTSEINYLAYNVYWPD